MKILNFTHPHTYTPTYTHALTRWKFSNLIFLNFLQIYENFELHTPTHLHTDLHTYTPRTHTLTHGNFKSNFLHFQLNTLTHLHTDTLTYTPTYTLTHRQKFIR